MFSPDVALLLITAVLSTPIFGGWFAWLATKVRRRRPQHGRFGEVADPGPSRVDPHAWGEPDLAPPPTSSAGAEVAGLERLWRLPAHRAGAGGDR
jgi:hypothetical protein